MSIRSTLATCFGEDPRVSRDMRSRDATYGVFSVVVTSAVLTSGTGAIPTLVTAGCFFGLAALSDHARDMPNRQTRREEEQNRAPSSRNGSLFSCCYRSNASSEDGEVEVVRPNA